MSIQPRLFTRNYMAVLAANFLLFFAFYLILPILPLYLDEIFNAESNLIGLILASYTIATLAIRPFAGYLLDTFSRKPLYLLTYLIFTVTICGYPLATTLILITLTRAIHGFSFGIVTVASNTIVIDIMPAERRGEGLGYYGLSNNFAMAFGPMVGLFLHKYYTFNAIFIFAIIAGTIGLLLALSVTTPYKPPVQRQAISLDRFFLTKGIPAGLCLALLAVPYSLTTTYIAVYAQQINPDTPTGFFFTFMAAGMMISRLFAGKVVDKGYVTQTITVGSIIAIFAYLCLGLTYLITSPAMITIALFGSAYLIGTAYGINFPAFNTLFVQLAPHTRRGTATSTYLTSWDVGIGIGLILGGSIAQYTNIAHAYTLGSALTLISTIMLVLIAAPHFKRNKVNDN